MNFVHLMNIQVGTAMILLGMLVGNTAMILAGLALLQA